MSHIPHRKEKDCLNCGTIVHGKFCHNCGQENLVPKETFWHMVSHFFSDITHFDSSFFHTVHHLVFKPGFLSTEYMKGRRASYLHPVRMYVFSSAIFFLLFFSFFKPHTGSNWEKPLTTEERSRYIAGLQKQLLKDTSNNLIKSKLLVAQDTSLPLTPADLVDTDDDQVVLQFTNKSYRSEREYDSIQNTLPKNERDGWLKRKVVLKQIDINDRFRHNPQGVVNEFVKSFLHRLPYMLFISLPLFALILRLVYIRKRKQFYFADHGVFTIHLYVFTFLLLLLVFALDKLEEITGWGFISTVIFFLFIGLVLYLLVAMRNFYGQKWWKTFIKFILVLVLSLAMMGLLFLLFMLFSVATF